MRFLEQLGGVIWNPWLLAFFLLVGGYISIATGFFQLFDIKLWFRTTAGSLFNKKKSMSSGGITQFQALSMAMASTVGTGSIAGVATAIFYGGPGAVFWMWVSAFLSMMTGFAEKTLSVFYRRQTGGRPEGGPMCYMEDGLGSRFLPVVFSFFCVAASFAGGNMVQANSIAVALEDSLAIPRPLTGVIIAVLGGAIVLGGLERVGKVSEKLVPAMAILFISGGLFVILGHASEIPNALLSILQGGLSPKAAIGGAAGYGISTAMRYGVARGVFTNEAGLGSSAMAHAASRVKDPVEEGMWGIFEVFAATIVACSVTALTILTSGAYCPDEALLAIQNGTVTDDMLGASLSAKAFSTSFGEYGHLFVSLSIFLLAFTSILGWSYYGERGVSHLSGSNRYNKLYRLIFTAFIFVGSVGDLTAIWLLVDIANGLMAFPNLITLLILSPKAISLLRDWKAAHKKKARIGA